MVFFAAVQGVGSPSFKRGYRGRTKRSERPGGREEEWDPTQSQGKRPRPVLRWIRTTLSVCLESTYHALQQQILANLTSPTWICAYLWVVTFLQDQRFEIHWLLVLPTASSSYPPASKKIKPDNQYAKLHRETWSKYIAIEKKKNYRQKQ